MDEMLRDELLDAVNTLIVSPAAHTLYDTMVSVVGVARRHPIQLVGEAQPLNALLRLMLRDTDAYDRVLTLVEQHRAEVGYDSLQRPVAEKFDKTEYMRAFMDRKRERQRRAAAIENMIRPPKDALRGRSRLDFMDRQASKWKAELDSRLERARTAAGGHLSREVTNNIREAFWEHVDRELTQLEDMAREELRKPAHRRSRPEATTAQLEAVLASDPYKK